MTSDRLVRAAILAAAAAVTAFSPCLAGDDADARARFKKEMDSVYDYLPFDVTQEVRNAKVKEMDRFWAFVASDLKTYLPLLREALTDEKSNRYFLYDGSGLLIEHSKTEADLQLAADATARCRMKDVGKGYFWFCHILARHGANDMAAILQMLEDPRFGVPLPMHSMVLRQEDCVRLCVLLVGEERAVPPLVARLATEKDPTARLTVLRCLTDAVTPDADAAVRKLAEDKEADASARAAAKFASNRAALAAKTPAGEAKEAGVSREELAAWLALADEKGRLPVDMREENKRDARLLVEASDVAVLRSLRRKTALRVSDEALLEIDYLTELLRRATAKPK